MDAYSRFAGSDDKVVDVLYILLNDISRLVGKDLLGQFMHSITRKQVTLDYSRLPLLGLPGS